MILMICKKKTIDVIFEKKEKKIPEKEVSLVLN